MYSGVMMVFYDLHVRDIKSLNCVDSDRLIDNIVCIPSTYRITDMFKLFSGQFFIWTPWTTGNRNSKHTFDNGIIHLTAYLNLLFLS